MNAGQFDARHLQAALCSFLTPAIEQMLSKADAAGTSTYTYHAVDEMVLLLIFLGTGSGNEMLR